MDGNPPEAGSHPHVAIDRSIDRSSAAVGEALPLWLLNLCVGCILFRLLVSLISAGHLLAQTDGTEVYDDISL